MADSRLLFTGPSPFGGHRYVLFDSCERRYGMEHKDHPMPLYDAAGGLVSPPMRGEGEPSAWELIRGTMVHIGLAHHYARKRAQQQGDTETYERLYPPLEAMQALHAEEKPLAHFDDRWNWDNALIVGENVLKKYMQRYAFERARVEIVEEVFIMELGANKAPYTLRLDLGLRDSANKVWMVDHKTTTSIRPDTAWGYALSTQFQAYAIAGRAVYGGAYGGVIANLIECPEPEDTVTPPVFVRPDMVAVPGFLYGFAERISEIWERMQKRYASGLPPEKWPKNPGARTCKAYGRICPHYAACVSTPD